MFNLGQCKKPHWSVKNGQLLLHTETEKEIELAKKVVTVLEAQIRQTIYEEISAWRPTDNKKQIVKAGIENVALQVQDICAQIALGKSKSNG